MSRVGWRTKLSSAGVVEVVESLLVPRGTKELSGARDVFRTDGLAVPARALGVDLLETLFVSFGSPFESFFKGVLGDFIVVVDKFPAALDSVFVVSCRGQLVGVPSQVDVQSWDGSVKRILGHNLDEMPVFLEETGHRVSGSWTVQPV